MIVDLSRVRVGDIPLVGGKGANLGELMAMGLPVPPGFAVTVRAYRAALAPVSTTMAELLAAGEHEALRDLVARAPLPADLEARLRQAVAALGGPVAVRSSATAEDLPTASFAGQQETALGVVGQDAVLEAIRRCWASLWTDRAISYREERGYDHERVGAAVVVQRMVPAAAAGVAFTADPVSGGRQVVIESSWGLGESVVSGAVSPDSFTVRGPRIASRPGDKPTRIDLAGSGRAVTLPVPDHLRHRPSLSGGQARAVARLARRVERHYGRPMDVEWALWRGRPWLLQARPITTAPMPSSPEAMGPIARLVHADILEHFPSPYPLDMAVVEFAVRCLARSMAVAGISLREAGALVTMDDDGAARIARPRITLWGLPLGLVRMARTPRRDPRDWHRGPARRCQALARRLAAVPRDADGARIAAALSEALEAWEHLLMVRFRDFLGAHVLRGQCLDLLMSASPWSQLDLLGDLDYATAVIDRRLRGIADDAPPRIRQALEAGPIEAGALRAAAPAWWAQVEIFLRDHGARTTTMYQPFSSSSWREDLPAFLTIVGAVQRSGARSPGAGPSHERIVSQAAARLPVALRPRLRRLVEEVRHGHVMREASVVEFEELGAAVRRLALIAGHRMVAAGLAEESRDVIYLRMEELQAWLRGEEVDAAAIIARRRRARPRAESAWAGAAPAVEPLGGARLSGTGASPGRASGPARVITGPAEFSRLGHGDVLVCQATDPAWTPLFALAAGVVAQTGGRLSHAAIVAREYGIPAVLGAAGALGIPDGAHLMIDGAAGTVTVASQA